MTMATLGKGQHLVMVASYTFGDLAHYHHGGEHGGTQVDVVLELRVLTSSKAGNRKSCDCHSEGSLSKRDLKAVPSVTHFLQQGHTS